MNQPSFVALVAVSLVLYLVALVGAGGASFDAGNAALAFVALASALAPFWVRSDEGSPGGPLVRAQAALLALSLAAFLALSVRSLLGELLLVACFPMLAVVTLELALFVPEVPPRLSRHVGWLRLFRLSASVCIALGALSVLPPMSLWGRTFILPFWLYEAPFAFALSAFTGAVLVRLYRRRLGSTTRALSANVWPTISLVVVFFGAGLSWLLHRVVESRTSVVHVVLAALATALLLGHVWLVSTRRIRVAYAWARELSAWGLAFFATCALLALSIPEARATFPETVALLAGAGAIFELCRRGFRRLAAVLLTPHGGALLRAIPEIREHVAGSESFEELVAQVLKPLRRAAGSPEAAPLIYWFHPHEELRLDAAGFARRAPRPLLEALRRRLESQPGEPIVRADLRQLLTRRPELSDVVKALDELAALCVLPLTTSSTLEGALVVAQGVRTDPLTFEELELLVALTRFIAPLLSVMSLVERARDRSSAEERARVSLRDELRATQEELGDARHTLERVRAAIGPRWSSRDPICYSPAMQALCAALEQVATQSAPMMLHAEAGLSVDALAELVHRQSGRSHAPMLVVDCGALEGTRALAALVGSAEGGRRNPGLLELAQGGTLLLKDIVALGHPAQAALADALAQRRAQALADRLAYSVDVRVIATAERSVDALLAERALAPELAHWLSAHVYRVPPLRECPEDVESLLLLALDRAARVLGKAVPGLTPDARAVLKAYDFPGNHAELERLLTDALRGATGRAIALSDLPALARSTALEASSLDEEREILRRALQRAGGNRARAARALGLKRATLIEKLRRLGLDVDLGRSGTEH